MVLDTQGRPALPRRLPQLEPAFSMDLQNDVTSWGMFVVALGLQINVNDVFVGNRSTGIHKSVVFQSRGARSDRIL